MALVSFRTGDRTLNLIRKTALKLFIAAIFKKEKKALSNITYIFCSDEFLLGINQEFLNHDFYTDIITFGLSEAGRPIEAEVYISLDRVTDNAKELGISYQNELLRVIFHGALHLCGYKDKKKSEIAEMRRKEDQYLRLYEKVRVNV